MGIYDRDYYRTERSGAWSYAPHTVVGLLIAINVAVWLADFFTPATLGVTGEPIGRWLSDHMAVHVDTLFRPWLWWQYLTAGFAHSPLGFQHILFNMLVLFFLGREVEEVYGPKEFLLVYLVLVVATAVVWNVVNVLFHASGVGGAYGASGAISGVVILYALNFPRRMLLLFFVVPIPAWLFGVLVVVLDMFGATGHGTPDVAYSMHLAGAALAAVYFWRGWRLSDWSFRRIAWPKMSGKPHLRVLNPEEESAGSDLTQQVDGILEKIYREGESSLTAKERKLLEEASREYQRKSRPKNRPS
ncbi:MAG: rhomboid family intramembrane serine protease [Planctomycetaceae bacterium]|nr:rhomboid family intramembrane serine protease [Planctomycetaceae bacterium]